MITEVLSASTTNELAGLVERPGHPDIGSVVRAGALDVTVMDSPDKLPRDIDAGLDFSAAGCGGEFAMAMAERGAALLVGTTALGGADKTTLHGLAGRIPVLIASNTSLGVFCLSELTLAARKLLGDSYDVEIVEMHHRHKKDSPSGTALSLAGSLAGAGPGIAVNREGPRKDGEVGVASVRGGEVVGTHTVYFLGPHDQIEICHRANSRMCLAEGAVRLGEALTARAPGLYEIPDLLR